MGLFSKWFRKDWRTLPFVEVAPRIKASLTAEALPTEVVQRDLGDLRAGLAVDVDGAPQFVESRDLARWAMQPEELWSRATGNLASDPALLVRPFPLPLEPPMELTVQLITAENEFAAGRLLLLERSGAGPMGALVAVPIRNAALFLPLPDRTAVVAAVPMLMMAAPLFDEGPASVSPHLFWFRGGRFQRLTQCDSPGELPRMMPSPEVEALLRPS